MEEEEVCLMWYKESQGNIALPADKNPDRETKYIQQINLENRRAGHRKQYVIRVYDYEDGTYSVVAYSGAINGRLREQPKGMYRSQAAAMSAAQSLQRAKEGSRGYRNVGDYTRRNLDHIGRPADSTISLSQPNTPTAPTAPSDGVFNGRQARNPNTPPEQLEEALFDENKHISLRCEVGENPSMRPTALDRFINTHSVSPTPNEVGILKRIAVNPTTAPSSLDTLLRNSYERDVTSDIPDNSSTSYLVVRNENTPVSTLNWVVGIETDELEGDASKVAEAAVATGKVAPMIVAKWKIKFGNFDDYRDAIDTMASSAMTSQDPEFQQKTIELILEGNYMGLTDNNTVENFIDRLLSTENHRDVVLNSFPERFFDEISMTAKNREFVEHHFGEEQVEDPQRAMMQGLFANNKSWYKKAMKVEIGEKGLDNSWQAPFKKETKCCKCGGNARIGFVTKEDGEKEYVCDLHSNEIADGGKTWLHDAVAVAVYFCEDCLEPTAKYNQG